MNMVGCPVTVHVSSGAFYEGVFAISSVRGGDDEGITLKMARKTSPEGVAEAADALKDVLVAYADMVQIEALKVDVRDSYEDQSLQVEDGFTDTGISGGAGGKQGELQMADADWTSRSAPLEGGGGLEDGLGGGGGAKWDQFAANEAKFGVRAKSWKELEHEYTTTVDQGSFTKSQRDYAARMAREIEGGGGGGGGGGGRRGSGGAADDEEGAFSAVTADSTPEVSERASAWGQGSPKGLNAKVESVAAGDGPQNTALSAMASPGSTGKGKRGEKYVPPRLRQKSSQGGEGEGGEDGAGAAVTGNGVAAGAAAAEDEDDEDEDEEEEQQQQQQHHQLKREQQHEHHDEQVQQQHVQHAQQQEAVANDDDDSCEPPPGATGVAARRWRRRRRRRLQREGETVQAIDGEGSTVTVSNDDSEHGTMNTGGGMKEGHTAASNAAPLLPQQPHHQSSPLSSSSSASFSAPSASPSSSAQAFTSALLLCIAPDRASEVHRQRAVECVNELAQTTGHVCNGGAGAGDGAGICNGDGGGSGGGDGDGPRNRSDVDCGGGADGTGEVPACCPLGSCRVTVTGSVATKTYLPDSDVDCVVSSVVFSDTPTTAQPQQQQQQQQLPPQPGVGSSCFVADQAEWAVKFAHAAMLQAMYRRGLTGGRGFAMGLTRVLGGPSGVRPPSSSASASANASANAVSPPPCHPWIVRGVELVAARVPVVKLVVNNQCVDVTVEQPDRRAAQAADFVNEFVARFTANLGRGATGRGGGGGGSLLFTHSVVLIKAFLKYEGSRFAAMRVVACAGAPRDTTHNTAHSTVAAMVSSPSLLGAGNGGLSSLATAVMVVGLFRSYGRLIAHPLDALYVLCIIGLACNTGL
jgi:hypothetical protein